jgi:hypothetical protein
MSEKSRQAAEIEQASGLCSQIASGFNDAVPYWMKRIVMG